MRALAIMFVCLLAGLSQALIIGGTGIGTAASAQTAPAPGAGKGFLIDKHAAAGVTCAKCHVESTAKPPAMATCLSCHGGTYAKLAAQTAQDQPNPHESHRGEVDCAECHHVHKVSVTKCNECHTYDMKTP